MRKDLFDIYKKKMAALLKDPTLKKFKKKDHRKF